MECGGQPPLCLTPRHTCNCHPDRQVAQTFCLRSLGFLPKPKRRHFERSEKSLFVQDLAKKCPALSSCQPRSTTKFPATYVRTFEPSALLALRNCASMASLYSRRLPLKLL
jgi:hypothetical protein